MENVTPAPLTAGSAPKAGARPGARVGKGLAPRAAPAKRRALGDITNRAQPEKSQQKSVARKHGLAAQPAKRAATRLDDAALTALVPRDKFGNVEDIEPLPPGYDYKPVYQPPVIDLGLDEDTKLDGRTSRSGMHSGPNTVEQGAYTEDLNARTYYRNTDDYLDELPSYLVKEPEPILVPPPHGNDGMPWDSSNGYAPMFDFLDSPDFVLESALDIDWPELSLKLDADEQ